MKKLFIIFTLLLTLTSCLSKNSSEVTESGTIDVPNTETGVIIGDDSAKDPAVLGTPEAISSTQATLPKDDKTAVATSTGTQTTKTEDEIVKDFEAEIDGLLNTIEKDGGN